MLLGWGSPSVRTPREDSWRSSSGQLLSRVWLLEALTCAPADELELDATFMNVKDMQETMACDVINTPALVIDEEVKRSGGNPRREEQGG